jgi:hypothetical protein
VRHTDSRKLQLQYCEGYGKKKNLGVSRGGH